MLLGGLFSELVDQRRARGKRYQQEPLLCALLLAVLSGATSLRKMELFIEERLGQLNALFGTTWKKPPTWVGIRRFLLKLDAGSVEEVVRRHAERQVPGQAGMQFIAFDGKALRGSASRVLDMRARQLVSAFTQDDLIILGHLEVDDKSNQIPAVQSLIESLGLSGRVFTLDAMHGPKKTLAIARSKGADVLGQVKENQAELLAMCQMLPQYQPSLQRHVDCDKGHGRIETRTIDTFVAPDAWLPEGWQPLIQAVVRVGRAVEHKRKGMAQVSEETAGWVSTVALSAQQFQRAIRGHWSGENQNHHVRDVVMLEDACRIREQPGILARLRSIALNCMRAGEEPCISRAIYRNTLNFDHALSIAHGRT